MVRTGVFMEKVLLPEGLPKVVKRVGVCIHFMHIIYTYIHMIIYFIHMVRTGVFMEKVLLPEGLPKVVKRVGGSLGAYMASVRDVKLSDRGLRWSLLKLTGIWPGLPFLNRPAVRKRKRRSRVENVGRHKAVSESARAYATKYALLPDYITRPMAEVY
jgi:hypothetical protein